jgi:hypothetical protein
MQRYLDPGVRDGGYHGWPRVTSPPRKTNDGARVSQVATTPPLVGIAHG